MALEILSLTIKNGRKLGPACENLAVRLCRNLCMATTQPHDFCSWDAKSPTSWCELLFGLSPSTSPHSSTLEPPDLLHVRCFHPGEQLTIDLVLETFNDSRRHQRFLCSRSRRLDTSIAIKELSSIIFSLSSFKIVSHNTGVHRAVRCTRQPVQRTCRSQVCETSTSQCRLCVCNSLAVRFRHRHGEASSALFQSLKCESASCVRHVPPPGMCLELVALLLARTNTPLHHRTRS